MNRKEKGHFLVETGEKSLSAGVAGRALNVIDYDLSHGEIRSAEKEILCGITGIAKRRIIMLDQVHGKRLIHVINDPTGDLASVGEADGLITPIKGILLVIRTADCVPVFIHDRKNSVLGAVHSGWKGTMLDISGRCVKEMNFFYGSDPAELQAYILPSIGPEFYEVNDDVAGHFPHNTIERDGKIYVNLWGEVERSLVKAGLEAGNIFNPNICNRKNSVEYFSHRFGDRGRNLNYAFMK